MRGFAGFVLCLPLVAALGLAAPSVTSDMVQSGTDIAAEWKAPKPGYDYEKREAMIPMRDGVKLHTVVFVPKGAENLPILFERTPYDAQNFSQDKPRMRDAVRISGREWADDGYIVVYQDMRGKYGSEGDYVMTRPPRGPLNPSKTDDTTDAYDSIAWLTDKQNLPETNGKVGMIGSSYDGWAVAMALLSPHPALKVAAPQSPMVDGWMGDDWYHHGAFRLSNLSYYTFMTVRKGRGEDMPLQGDDDYQSYLDAGSAGAMAQKYGLDQLPFWTRMAAHPAYDGFWQLQAMDKLVAGRPSKVPTMWLQGLWDQEDMYGAVHAWEELVKAGFAANNHLVMGPWYHSQINYAGETLGPLKWKGDTAADFRREVLIPFFNTYLKDRKPAYKLPRAMIFNAADKKWESFAHWKIAERQKRMPLYLQAGFALGFDKPASGSDSYVSDPAKPIPYIDVPINGADRQRWKSWLVQDQRPYATRTDVLAYKTEILTEAVKLEGAPIADLYVRTTGTDADFIVKLIDVYPPRHGEQPELAGYQLAISQDIFRARYRNSFEKPEPMPPGRVQHIQFRLPTVNYAFKPGHRIMVQIQSSQFPVYERNPQSYVPNILFAKPEDYVKATMTVERGAEGASAVLLPIVTKSTAKE